MNTNIPAFANANNTVSDKVVFNQSTNGLDLRIEGFSLDAFEQVGNGVRLVIKDRVVGLGTEAALEDPNSRVFRVQNLTQAKAAVSAFATLIQSKDPSSFKIGFHPRAGIDRDVFQFGEVGLVKSNYKGFDIADIPADNKWHGLMETPVAGGGTSYYIGKAVSSTYQQITHEMIDLIIDGFIIQAVWPEPKDSKMQGLSNFLAVTLGANDASLGDDEELKAIYATRYNEAVNAKKLDRKAAATLAQVEPEQRKAVALQQDLVMVQTNGEELDVLSLSPGQLVRFEDRTGRHQGQRAWRPESPYCIQAFAEAAKMGMYVELL